MHSNGSRMRRRSSSCAYEIVHGAMNREDVVRVPQALGVIAIDDRLDFVGDVADRAAAMRFAEHRSAAPRAGVRTAARGYSDTVPLPWRSRHALR
jgi:hypothetical protein